MGASHRHVVRPDVAVGVERPPHEFGPGRYIGRLPGLQSGGEARGIVTGAQVVCEATGWRDERDVEREFVGGGVETRHGVSRLGMGIIHSCGQGSPA